MNTYNPVQLIQVIRDLLSPEGCPWDRQQTPDSLCEYLIEETYELVEAIRKGDLQDVREEMGDVFFLLFFIAILYEGNAQISLHQVWLDSAAKMKARHPHVFADEQISSLQDLKKSWEKIKKQEKQNKVSTNEDKESFFDSVPETLPPLLQAYRLNSRAAQQGFTWNKDFEQKVSVQTEWLEWLQACKKSDKQNMEEEFGDLLFSLVELGRRQGIKANAALQKANLKFVRRCDRMYALAKSKKLNWQELDLLQLNQLWEEVKVLEKSEQ